MSFIDDGTGVHEIIFATEAVCSLVPLKPALERALTRWKSLWEDHKERASIEVQGHVGFYQNAIEYWWLARLFLDNEIATTGQNRNDFGQNSMKDVNEFIKRFTYLSITE